MSSDHGNNDDIIGVGAVGVLPGEEEGLLEELPEGEHFELVAFSDEGVGGRAPEFKPAPYFPDYNVMLREPEVELVLVNGPLELRRDLAVRALNAGKHIVLPLPIAETALGGDRILKTALKQDLVATADCSWRDAPDLLALQEALMHEDLGPVQGLFLFTTVEEPPRPEESLADLLFLEEEPGQEEEPAGPLAEHGVEVLDQLHQLAGDYVKNVNAHRLVHPARETEKGFMVYLALRGGGWAVGQAATGEAPQMPGLAVYTDRGTVTASGGTAVVTVEGEEIAYETPVDVEDFWDNLYAAIRHGAELKCPPVDIVRAMKLHEAARESLEVGEAVSI